MRLRHLLAVIALIAPSVSQVETQPYRNLGDLHATVLDAEQNGKTFRLYESPGELRVAIGIGNPDLVIDDARLIERVSFSLAGDQAAPIAVTWPSNVSSRSARWTATLARKDGHPFAAGRYSLEVSVRAAYEAMQTTDGERVRGVERQSVAVVVDIREPASARERSAALRMSGKKKLAENASEGFRLLVLATEADPTDLGALLDLGRAYVGSKRCKEAVAIFESALSLQRKFPDGGFQHSASTIPYSLAHAYVCVGDQTRAAQVLRDGGVSETSIKDSLERFRMTVPK